MIPEFSVTLTKENNIKLDFVDAMPPELVTWIKDSLLCEFRGLIITRLVAERMGGVTEINVTRFVNQGVLYKDEDGGWKLNGKLEKWVEPIKKDDKAEDE